MLKKLCLRAKKKNKGFTLVELVVVIAILAILAAIAIPQLLGFQDRAKEQADKQTMAQVRNAVALLHANGEIYPSVDNTTFTMDDDGTLAYSTGTFQDKVSTDSTAVAIDDGDAEDLIKELTGDIDLQGDKDIQIIMDLNGSIEQSLI